MHIIKSYTIKYYNKFALSMMQRAIPEAQRLRLIHMIVTDPTEAPTVHQITRYSRILIPMAFLSSAHATQNTAAHAKWTYHHQ